MSLESVVRCAWDAYDREDYADMVACASQLVLAGDPWAVLGYFLRGMANEHWQGGPDECMRLAVSDYRTAATLAPHANAYQNLARALMKMGSARYEQAHRYLLEGWAFEESPELMLGFGHYFLTKPAPEPARAMSFYRRAAMRGRFRGFIVAAQICKSTGRPLQAALWNSARIVLAPLLWLTQGRRAMFEF